ncbi:cupredoxin domain-containing protein [Paenibacillus aestuarii]|uniref:Cupredoxin domain-containing protein n=1 Tax=Paenibacillus aestuarii TaxID=516965 RepID=A0ABW0KHC6_9BACL|nr:cupredoxin domain-containing protein [Paenibacillus aestuarii]
MKKKWKLAFTAAGLIIGVSAALLIYTQGRPDPVDPLLAEQAAGYQVATVQVTADGFVPNHLDLKAGVPAKINFIKTTGLTCIKSMASTELGLDVPLDKGNNIVTLDHVQPGTYTYHCGMYMYNGTFTIN